MIEDKRRIGGQVEQLLGKPIEKREKSCARSWQEANKQQSAQEAKERKAQEKGVKEIVQQTQVRKFSEVIQKKRQEGDVDGQADANGCAKKGRGEVGGLGE